MGIYAAQPGIFHGETFIFMDKFVNGPYTFLIYWSDQKEKGVCEPLKLFFVIYGKNVPKKEMSGSTKLLWGGGSCVPTQIFSFLIHL